MTVDLKLFIAGEWTSGSGSEAYQLRSPATGEHLANVPLATDTDLDRAVAAARAATETMRHWSAFERAALCLRAYQIWQGRIEEMARILTLEQGKPFRAEAIDDIGASASKCAAELDAVADCYDSNPPTCDSDGVQVSTACGKALLAYASCNPGIICTSSSTTRGCSYECSGTSASCEQSETSWMCTCTAGARNGTSYTPTSGNGCDRDSLETHCGL